MTDSTPTPQRHHVLTFTRIALDDDDDVEDFDHEIAGPHGNCLVWYPCEVELVSIKVRAGWPWTPPLGMRPARPQMSAFRTGRCPHTVTDDEDIAGEYEAHGVEHQYLDGDWMTESSRCAAGEADVSDDIWEIAREHGAGPHDVDVEYYGDGMWDLNYVGPHASSLSSASA